VLLSILKQLNVFANGEQIMKRIASVVFNEAFNDNTKRYHYFTNDDSIKVGDICVVDSSPGYGVVEVKGFVEKSGKATHWIVQKIDLEAHKANLERESQINEIKFQLKMMKEKVEEKMVWKMLAEQNKEAAELLKKLEDLEG
jgi:hypothetical protein